MQVALTGAIAFSYCMGTIAALIDVTTGIDDRCKARQQARDIIYNIIYMIIYIYDYVYNIGR